MSTKLSPTAAAEVLLSAYKAAHEARIGKASLPFLTDEQGMGLSEEELASHNSYFNMLADIGAEGAETYKEWTNTASFEDKRAVGRYIFRKVKLPAPSMASMETYLNII